MNLDLGEGTDDLNNYRFGVSVPWDIWPEEWKEEYCKTDLIDGFVFRVAIRYGIKLMPQFGDESVDGSVTLVELNVLCINHGVTPNTIDSPPFTDSEHYRETLFVYLSYDQDLGIKNWQDSNEWRAAIIQVASEGFPPGTTMNDPKLKAAANQLYDALMDTTPKEQLDMNRALANVYNAPKYTAPPKVRKRNTKLVQMNRERAMRPPYIPVKENGKEIKKSWEYNLRHSEFLNSQDYTELIETLGIIWTPTINYRNYWRTAYTQWLRNQKSSVKTTEIIDAADAEAAEEDRVRLAQRALEPVSDVEEEKEGVRSRRPSFGSLLAYTSPEGVFTPGNLPPDFPVDIIYTAPDPEELARDAEILRLRQEKAKEDARAEHLRRNEAAAATLNLKRPRLPGEPKPPQFGGNRGSKFRTAARLGYAFNKGTLIRLMRRANVKRAAYKGGILTEAQGAVGKVLNDTFGTMRRLNHKTVSLPDILRALYRGPHIRVYAYDSGKSVEWVSKRSRAMELGMHPMHLR